MERRQYAFRKSVEKLIANLRGVPEDVEPVPPKTERDLGSVVERLMSRYKIGVESLEDRINENWPQIVGAANAKNCSPARIDRDVTLLVAVANPIIRQELEFNKRLILKNLHAIPGGKQIRFLVFKSG